MFNPRNNLLNAVFMNEIDELIDNQTQNVNNESNLFIDDELEMIFDASSISNELKSDIIKENFYIDKDTYSYDNRVFYNECITESEPFKIEGKYTFENAIKLSFSIYKELGDEFFGVILSNGIEKINPLHIFLSMNIVENYEKFKDEIFEIIVYNVSKNAIVFFKDKEKIIRPENVEKVIQNLVSLYEHRKGIVSNITCSQSREQVKSNFLAYTAKDIELSFVINDDKIKDSITIVPTQIETDGLAIPSYGAVMFVTNRYGESVAYNITPFGCCNVGSRTEGYYGEYHSGSNYCLGSGSRDGTVNGFKRMNVSNLSSQLSGSNMKYGSFAIKNEMIKASYLAYSNVMDLDIDSEDFISEESTSEVTENDIYIQSRLEDFEPNPVEVGLYSYTLAMKEHTDMSNSNIIKRYRELSGAIKSLTPLEKQDEIY